MRDEELLGYAVVVALKGRDGDLASGDVYSLDEAQAELDKLAQPPENGGRLVKVAGMLVDPKDVKAAFVREVREDMLDRLARELGRG